MCRLTITPEKNGFSFFDLHISVEYFLFRAPNPETDRGGDSGKCGSDFPSVEETIEEDGSEAKLKT